MSGIAEDGPLHNALVFLDYDRDGQLDKGEPLPIQTMMELFTSREKDTHLLLKLMRTLSIHLPAKFYLMWSLQHPAVLQLYHQQRL